MKVVVLHNLPAGGARRRLAQQLERLDVEVAEICLGTAKPITADAQVVGLTRRAPEAHPALRPPLRYADLAALRRAWHRAGALAASAGADVIYANPCKVLQAPAGLLAGGLPPAVYFCDEPRRVDYEPSAQAMRNPRTRLLYAPLYRTERALDRRAVARAAHILTNSRYTARAIAAAYGRDAEAVPMGVPERLLAGDGSARAPGSPRHLLTVGALIPGKGHELVIRAAAGGPWPVVLVTPRPDPSEEARLRGVAAAVGVTLEVRVGVSDDELRETYNSAFATLYLARAEPLGLVSLEAQACGSPVVVADEGGLPETVRDGESGFVVAREPAAAAAALTRLGEGDRRAVMGAAARAHARAWTWKASAERVQAALEDVAR